MERRPPRLLLVVILAGLGQSCGDTLDIDGDRQSIEYDKPFNTIFITEPKGSLLRGYHPSFDTPSRKTCVEAKEGAKPLVDEAGEDFALEYKEAKRELRSFFNVDAEAKADLKLIHAKAAMRLAEAVDRDSFALMFALHAYQYFRSSYDARDLSLTREARELLENKAGLPIEDLAREQLFQCGAGYLRALYMGGQLDAVMEVTGSSFSKTAELKKSVEVAGILGNKQWYDDKTITEKLAGVTVKVRMFAKGFAWEGKPITDFIAETYVRTKVDEAVRAKQNPVLAAVNAMKKLHEALKQSVTADQKSCSHALVFQAVIGNYFDLDDVPIQCGSQPMLRLRQRVNELADLMGKFALAYLTADQAARRANQEIEDFETFVDREKYPDDESVPSGYAFETAWHRHGLVSYYLEYRWFDPWMAPYIGLYGWRAELGTRPELGVGVRIAARRVYAKVAQELTEPPGDRTVITRATQDPHQTKEWIMLTQDPRSFTDPTWGVRTYWDDKVPTHLRNLYTYRSWDRVRPTYVVRRQQRVSGEQIRNNQAACDASKGERWVNADERFALAPWAGSRVFSLPTKRYWVDPAIQIAGGCNTGAPISAQTARYDTKYPPEFSGSVHLGCGRATDQFDLVCVPAALGVFGGANPFDL
jgi:hypothetical protein